MNFSVHSSDDYHQVPIYAFPPTPFIELSSWKNASRPLTVYQKIPQFHTTRSHSLNITKQERDKKNIKVLRIPNGNDRRHFNEQASVKSMHHRKISEPIFPFQTSNLVKELEHSKDVWRRLKNIIRVPQSSKSPVIEHITHLESRSIDSLSNQSQEYLKQNSALATYEIVDLYTRPEFPILK